MARYSGGVWVLAAFALFLCSVGVYLAAPSMFPINEAGLEETHAPLPAGPHKYQ